MGLLGRRKRGRPKKRYLDFPREDMDEVGETVEEVNNRGL